MPEKETEVGAHLIPEWIAEYALDKSFKLYFDENYREAKVFEDITDAILMDIDPSDNLKARLTLKYLLTWTMTYQADGAFDTPDLILDAFSKFLEYFERCDEFLEAEVPRNSSSQWWQLCRSIKIQGAIKYLKSIPVFKQDNIDALFAYERKCFRYFFEKKSQISGESSEEIKNKTKDEKIVIDMINEIISSPEFTKQKSNSSAIRKIQKSIVDTSRLVASNPYDIFKKKCCFYLKNIYTRALNKAFLFKEAENYLKNESLQQDNPQSPLKSSEIKENSSSTGQATPLLENFPSSMLKSVFLKSNPSAHNLKIWDDSVVKGKIPESAPTPVKTPGKQNASKSPARPSIQKSPEKQPPPKSPAKQIAPKSPEKQLAPKSPEKQVAPKSPQKQPVQKSPAKVAPTSSPKKAIPSQSSPSTTKHAIDELSDASHHLKHLGNDPITSISSKPVNGPNSALSMAEASCSPASLKKRRFTDGNDLEDSNIALPYVAPKEIPNLGEQNATPHRLTQTIRKVTKTKRVPWSADEVNNLISGVRSYGAGNWKHILQSYDFDDRTAVDLKDKWRNMKRGNQLPPEFKDT